MWPVLLGGTAVIGSLAWLFARKKPTAIPTPNVPAASNTGIVTGSTTKKITDPPTVTGPSSASDPFADAVVVTDPQGVAWLVARDYIGPVSAGQGEKLAKAAGGELPSPALVDAIWRAADLKVLPPVRSQNIVSAAVFADQAQRIKGLVGNQPFNLVAGTYKDIATLGGHAQLYGWHVEDSRAAEFTKKTGVPLHKAFSAGPGQIIQGPSGSVHSPDYVDYSQGVRLVKRA